MCILSVNQQHFVFVSMFSPNLYPLLLLYVPSIAPWGQTKYFEMNWKSHRQLVCFFIGQGVAGDCSAACQLLQLPLPFLLVFQQRGEVQSRPLQVCIPPLGHHVTLWWRHRRGWPTFHININNNIIWLSVPITKSIFLSSLTFQGNPKPICYSA